MNNLRFIGKTKRPATLFHQASLRSGCFLLFLLTALASQGVMTAFAQSEKPLIKEVRLEKMSEQEVRVFISLSEPCIPDIFPIEEEKLRLVCDFPNARIANNIQRTTAGDGKIIESVRYGVHYSPKSKIRIVFDLQAGYDYKVDQIYFQKDNALMIVICQNEKN